MKISFNLQADGSDVIYMAYLLLQQFYLSCTEYTDVVVGNVTKCADSITGGLAPSRVLCPTRQNLPPPKEVEPQV